MSKGPKMPLSIQPMLDEVKKGLKMTDFNISNAIARIKEQGDIFKPVMGKGIDIKKAEKMISAL